MWPFTRKQKIVTWTNSIGMAFVEIEAGSFTMGSPQEEPERVKGEWQHQVTITRPFMLGVTPVTQKQWKTIMGNNPSEFFSDEERPVENVSWGDAMEFLDTLSRREHRHYRLPSEAEWEYACRAGTTTPFNFGETITDDLANYNATWVYKGGNKGEHRGKTTAVKTFPPNDWGLYDMHGNVWEWCNDRYGPYPENAVTDPLGARSGTMHVARGGSWMHTPRRARSASRSSEAPVFRANCMGFRAALDAIRRDG